MPVINSISSPENGRQLVLTFDVPAGMTRPWVVLRVRATGTTATGIRAFF